MQIRRVQIKARSHVRHIFRKFVTINNAFSREKTGWNSVLNEISQKINRNSLTRLKVVARSFEIQCHLRELEPSKSWPEDESFQLGKSSNLYTYLSFKHLLKEHRCKFKIDRLNDSNSYCRTTYYFNKKKRSKRLSAFLI